jgi:hypothetical protein
VLVGSRDGVTWGNLERFPAKWELVRRQKARQIKC